MFGAGALSGLLGIGSGAVKVLALDQAMRIPFKVSTTTSNFMIGVTAAASAGVYLSRGYIDPGLSMPVMLGVVAGSLAGTRILVHAETKRLRLVFSIVILLLGAQMIYNGAADNLVYSTGWALFDKKDPTRVLARSDQPVFGPEQEWEKVGQVPNVVFVEGAVRDGKRWLFYYGGADKYVGVATAPAR